MPILASNIISLCRSALDAEGSDYYTDQQDFIPAINQAQLFLVSLINSQLGGKKFAEEYYRDLIKNRVFQTSIYSRVDVTPANPNEKVWTILSIVTEPTLNAPFTSVNTVGGISIARPTFFYVSGGFACARLTAEEWTPNAKNPFAEGYSLEPATLNKSYAYLTHIDYNSNLAPSASPNEIEIRPALSRQPVAITFVKLPSPVVNSTDSVDFPDSFMDIIVKATLREIAFKQGDKTTISTLSNQEILTMLQSTF